LQSDNRLNVSSGSVRDTKPCPQPRRLSSEAVIAAPAVAAPAGRANNPALHDQVIDDGGHENRKVKRCPFRISAWPQVKTSFRPVAFSNSGATCSSAGLSALEADNPDFVGARAPSDGALSLSTEQVRSHACISDVQFTVRGAHQKINRHRYCGRHL
jgi:hypothetical protein